MQKGKRLLNCFDLIRTVIAIALAVAIAVAIICVVSKTPGDAVWRFLIGPVSSKRYFFNVIELMTPLMFTGLAVSLMLQVKVFNLAVEGVFYTGGLVAAIVACLLPMPGGIHPLAGLLLGAAAGGLVALIPAVLKTRFEANEVVSSLMLNYVVFKIGDYILKTFLRDPQSTHVVSYEYPSSAYIPKITGNIHLGLPIVIVLLVAAYFFLYHARWGFKIRITGENRRFAKYTGVKVTGVILLSQIIGGCIAGLGGASYILGATQRFTWEWRSGYGWDGLVVAIVARNNPRNVPLAAFILAYLRIGSDLMSRMSDVQNEVVSIIQGIIIVLIAASMFLSGWRKRLVVSAATAGLASGKGEAS